MADKVHCIRKTLRLMPQEAKVLSDKAKANGMNEATLASTFSGFETSPIAIKKGIIINIIRGQIPCWASWSLSNMEPTAANNPRNVISPTK